MGYREVGVGKGGGSQIGAEERCDFGVGKVCNVRLGNEA